MIHELKIDPEYFAAVRNGEKQFELRRNDRNFSIGDYLALNEYDRVQRIIKAMARKHPAGKGTRCRKA
jgi:ASC-1-like (ASCH) protein